MAQSYFTPQTLDQALVDLATPGCRAIAGGTDIMVEIRSHRLAGDPFQGSLVDLSGLNDLCDVREEGDEIIVGSGLTFSQISAHPLIGRHLPLLAQAARTVGSKQIRNLATIGGNVANQSPAADGANALVALSAQAELARAGRARCHMVDELLSPEGLCTLEPGELIVCFRVPKPKAPFGSAFRKIIRRRAVAIARFSVACVLELAPNGASITQAGLALGAVFPSPQRVRAVEDALVGREGTPQVFAEAGRVACEIMLAVSGNRPSMIYKEPAVRKVVTSTIAAAFQRAQRAAGAAK